MMILALTTIVFSLLSVHSYNLDTKYPIIFADPLKSNSNNNVHDRRSYFGYSVLLIPVFGKLESQYVSTIWVILTKILQNKLKTFSIED